LLRCIRKDFYDTSNLRMKVYPIGDIHIGAGACDEDKLIRLVADIKDDPSAWWIGMGDYIEAIKRNDKRFDPTTLADWIDKNDLVDLAQAQADHFLQIIAPIAHKCLGLLTGNHEAEMTRYYEHDIYGTIIKEVKRLGGFSPETSLRLGYYGWLQLGFFKTQERDEGSRTIMFNLHHGKSAGSSGGQINSMEGWLARKAADVLIVGHTHKLLTTKISVEYVGKNLEVLEQERYGVVSSSFLRSSIPDNDGTYNEKKMYLPLPTGTAIVDLFPHAPVNRPQIKVITW
jgi:hypothetical protein